MPKLNKHEEKYCSDSVCFFVPLLLLQELATAATITFTNNCPHTVWPGILTGNLKTQLSTTDFELAVGASKSEIVGPVKSGTMVPVLAYPQRSQNYLPLQMTVDGICTTLATWMGLTCPYP